MYSARSRGHSRMDGLKGYVIIRECGSLFSWIELGSGCERVELSPAWSLIQYWPLACVEPTTYQVFGASFTTDHSTVWDLIQYWLINSVESHSVLTFQLFGAWFWPITDLSTIFTRIYMLYAVKLITRKHKHGNIVTTRYQSTLCHNATAAGCNSLNAMVKKVASLKYPRENKISRQFWNNKN